MSSSQDITVSHADDIKEIDENGIIKKDSQNSQEIIQQNEGMNDKEIATSGDDITVQPPAKKRIVIGVPGDKFSNNFLLCWTRTLYALWESGKYEVMIAPGTSSFVSFARMKTLGLDVLRGKDQKPFGGNMDYFAWITLDSDIVYTPECIMELLAALEVRPVVAGYYAMADGKSFAVVKDWDTHYFAKNGSFKFLQKEDIDRWQADTQQLFMPVSYSGLGFFGARKEVLDSLKYPYFNTDLQRIDGLDGIELVDICSEDVALCKNIQKAGFEISLHTNLRVLHEKSILL